MITDGLLIIILVLLFIVIALAVAAFGALRAGAASAEPGAATVGGDEYGEYGNSDDSGEYKSYDDVADYGGESLFDVTGGYPGYYMPIREPWFEMMLNGEKLVEARLNRGPAANLKVGDLITVARSRPAGDTKEYPGARRFVTKVKRVKHYKSIEDMVKEEGAEKLFPGLTGGVKAVVDHYREFSKEADEVELLKNSSHAFVAIEIVPLTAEEKKVARSAVAKPKTTKTTKAKKSMTDYRYDN
jgi:ASC-1-like (ASCH) protein